MPKVDNLLIKPQTGADGTYVAEWDFNVTGKKPSSSGSGSSVSSTIKVGAWVYIKPGSKWYNGATIPDFVMNDCWNIIEINGDRAVLGKNKNGTNNIQSPINTKNLTTSKPKSADIEPSTREGTQSEIDTLDHYLVKWYYDSGDGIWFNGNDANGEETKRKYSLYSPPSQARKLRVDVKPISKTHKVNNKDVHYWTGTTVRADYYLASDKPGKAPVPDVTIDKYTLTATIVNVSDPKADKCRFYIYRDNKRFKVSEYINVRGGIVSYSCPIEAGGEYRVRARYANVWNGKLVEGEASDYSGTNATIPPAPTMGSLRVRAGSETSVILEWDAVDGAENYDIEYATKAQYLEGSDAVSAINGVTGTHYEKTGLDTGGEYFFHMRACNSTGKSGWSEIVSVLIGKAPAAPTTWSSVSVAIVGEPLIFYWVHNALDNSVQTSAEIEIIVDGRKENHVIDTSSEPDDKKTMQYEFDTKPYVEGTKIEWRVRTAGATKTLGDWSIKRSVDIYAPPTLNIRMTDIDDSDIRTLTKFPFYIKANAGPRTQKPVSFHVSISSIYAYDTLDDVGNIKHISAGEEVYSNSFDINKNLVLEISAMHIDLENNQDYHVKVTVSMNSGLSTDSSLDFNVSWEVLAYEPDIEIGIDEDNWSAYLGPYCLNPDMTPVEDVTLAVYRKEFDGKFTEISSNIPTDTNMWITDPHPALDYARYRVVAKSKSTGSVSFYDPPPYPVSCVSTIIQWNDAWVDFNAGDGNELVRPPWTGSMLKIPYNIDISDSHKPDSELVEYIGREHPVSYYGTQLGHSSTWNMEIPADDEETLYGLRRLSVWTGDVYVREPSGTGYWANVHVSYSKKHCVLTIPITLIITRVEGGI